ncbi:MAG: hypothetical protein ABIE55_04490 [Candidatus Aenigmatarchaeota archaeon]
MTNVTLMVVLLIVTALIVSLLGTSIWQQFYRFDPEGARDAAIKQLGSEGDITYTTPIIKDPLEPDILTHLLPLEAWEPFQPSEIACHIANIIHSDYQTYGRETLRGERILSFANELIISSGKIFTLKEFTQNEMIANGGVWETVLNDVVSGPCHLCQEGGTAIPLLDETCVNMQLKDRKVESSNFCNGGFIPRMTDNSFEIKFGNNVCYVPNKNKAGSLANWDNHCQGGDNDGNWPNPIFCDNGQDLIYDWNRWWVADCAGSGCDVDPQITPEYDTRYLVNEIENLDTKGILDHDERHYVFGVTWIPEKEKYNVNFARIPHINLADSTTDMLDRIGDVVSNKGSYSNWEVRNNYLGFYTRQARSVMDFIFRGDDQTGLIEVKKKIEEVTDDLSFDNEDCIGLSPNEDSTRCILSNSCEGIDDCLKNQGVITFKGAELVEADSLKAFLESHFMGSCWQVTCQDRTPKSIVVKSNVEPNENFKSEGVYRVVVNNWFSIYDSGISFHIGSCFWPGSPCWRGISYLRDVVIINVTGRSNNCCDADGMTLSVTDTGSSARATIGNLRYCYDHDVYFFDQECDGKNVGFKTPLAVFNIDSQQSKEDSLYCWAGEPYNPQPFAITKTLSYSSTDNYYACIDIDKDGDFDEWRMATMDSGGGGGDCPDKCEIGKEYKGGSGSPCTYSSVKNCKYGCEGTVCKAGWHCDQATAICRVCATGLCTDCGLNTGGEDCCTSSCNCVGGGICYEEGNVPHVLCDVECYCGPFWVGVSKVVTDCSACNFANRETNCGGTGCGVSGCKKVNCGQTEECTYNFWEIGVSAGKGSICVKGQCATHETGPVTVPFVTGETVTLVSTPDESSNYACVNFGSGQEVCSYDYPGTPGPYPISGIKAGASGIMYASFMVKWKIILTGGTGRICVNGDCSQFIPNGGYIESKVREGDLVKLEIIPSDSNKYVCFPLVGWCNENRGTATIPEIIAGVSSDMEVILSDNKLY